MQLLCQKRAARHYHILACKWRKTSFKVEYHNRGFFLYDDADRTVSFSNRYSNMDDYY